MAKSHSQLVNLPGAWPLMNPLLLVFLYFLTSFLWIAKGNTMHLSLRVYLTPKKIFGQVVCLKLLRESSFNMTRGGDGDIEGGSEIF